MSEVEGARWHLQPMACGSMGPRIVMTTTIDLMPCHGVKWWETPATEDSVCVESKRSNSQNWKVRWLFPGVGGWENIN